MSMKFSIGIPAFKAKFLKQTIDSILSQTEGDFELIIVNDASPDNIEEIVNNYSDIRLRYYSNETNFGAEHVVDNWNKCLSFAKGEFFILMGDDDILASNYLEEFIKLISRFPDLDIFHCRSLLINDKSTPFSMTQALPEYESVYENIWHRINEWRGQYVSDFVYRTNVLKSNGGFYKIKLAWASDDITSFIAMTKKGIAHINLPLLFYRRSNITISSSGSVLLKLEAIKAEERWYNDFVKTNSPRNQEDKFLKSCIELELPKYFKKKVISTIAYHGYTNKGLIFRLVFWFRNRGRYDLNYKEILYAFVLALKKKHATRAFI